MPFAFAVIFSLVLTVDSVPDADYIVGVTEGNDITGVQLTYSEAKDFYSIKEDTTLLWQQDQKINYSQSDGFWMRFSIKNPSRYGKDLAIWIHPQIENELYYFDYDSGKWISQKAGLFVDDQKRSVGIFYVSLPPETTSVFYSRIDVSRVQDVDRETDPIVWLNLASEIHEGERFVLVIWIATLVIVLVFFFYNAYIYYFFRDTTYLYYLLIQIGAVGYITGFHQYLNVFLPARWSTFYPAIPGGLYYFSLNLILIQLMIIVILIGFVQLTRAYLETALRAPKLDKVLRGCLYVFSAFTLINTFLTGTGLYFSNYQLSKYINIGVMLIILLMFYTGIVLHRKKYKPAGYFLMANSAPLLVMAFLAGYFIFFKFNDEGSLIVPSLAIVTQSISFAIALVARVQLLKDELAGQQIEVQKEKGRNEKLREKIEYNQRELASSAMYAYQKNKLLADLKKKIEQLSESMPKESNSALRQIKSTIQSNMYLDGDWEKFKMHFEQVHPHFFEQLKQEYPNLTQNEIRLCAYFQINLSVKEIAALMNIDPESVRKAKTRLNKKIRSEDPVSG